MGVDDTVGGVETVEDQAPADRPPPPPPPDDPGAEPEGVPSRADSRAAAAAANKPETSQPAEDKPEPPPEPDSSESNESTVGESTAPGSQETSSDSGERDVAVELSTTDEQPIARDVETEPLDGPGATAAFDGDAEQPPSTLAASAAADTPIDAERAPRTSEPVDQDVDEAAAPPRAEDAGLFDDPGNEREGVPSRADSRAGAAVANGEVGEQPSIDNTNAPSGQAEGTALDAEIQNTPTDAHPGANDLTGGTPQPEHDDKPAVETAEQQTPDEWTWTEEFAARAQARETAATANAEQTDGSPADAAATNVEFKAHDASPATQNPSDAIADLDQPRSDDGSEVTDPAEKKTETLGEEDRPDTEFMVGDKLVRVRGDLDPVGGDVDPGGSVDVEPEPAGDRIADGENDEKSRAERLRRKFYEASEEVRDGVRDTSDAVQDLLPRRPPTSHPETRTGPVYAAHAEHHGIDAGDTATALLATGFVIVEVGRWIHGKLGREKEET